MIIEKCRENYFSLSGKASSIVRQLGFAGIALIWIFRSDIEGIQKIPDALIPASLGIVIGLSLDLLHYVVGAAIWGMYARFKEKQGIGEEDEFEAPYYINWPALVFFWGKIIAMVWAYCLLLDFLWDSINLNIVLPSSSTGSE